MRNKEIVEYKDNIFLAIKKFFSKIFNKEKDTKNHKNTENNDNIEELNKKIESQEKIDNKASFDEIKEKDRIMHLKFLYDNGQLDDEDISDEDAKKLVKLYEEETKRLNEDTKVRLNKIEKMMKQK